MNILGPLIVCLALITPLYSVASDNSSETKKSPTIKEICKVKKDKSGKELLDKTGKTIQECKKIKVHKKLEGKEIPGQKK